MHDCNFYQLADPYRTYLSLLLEIRPIQLSLYFRTYAGAVEFLTASFQKNAGFITDPMTAPFR